MAAEVQDMWNICRFCLTQEEDVLAPVTTILDSYLTIEHVERFTGVSIEVNDKVQYAVCVYCTYRLQESIAFRSACISNDPYLRRLCGQTGKAARPSARKLNACDDQDPLAVKAELTSKAFVESPSNQKKKEKKVEVEFKETIIEKPFTVAVRDSDGQPQSNTSNEPDVLETVEEFYSANYIEPGGLADSETDERDLDVDHSPSSSTSSNKAGTLDKSQKGPKQRISFTTKEGICLFNLSLNEHKKTLCDVCGKLVSDIVSHKLSHAKETIFACPHCPTRMTHNANLMRHIHAVHLKTIIKTCELCGKGFTHKNTYLSHQRAQHGIGSMHECKLCSKKFGHPSGLRAHFLRAHGSQCYKCSICGMCFKMKKEHATHQRVHSSDKPYPCSECPKRFKSRMARNNHELTHRGVLFKCTICEKSYSYKSLLNMHFRKMHTTHNDGGE